MKLGCPRRCSAADSAAQAECSSLEGPRAINLPYARKQVGVASYVVEAGTRFERAEPWR